MQSILTKIKEYVNKYGHDLFVLVCIILAAWSGYNIGKIQSVDKQPLKFSQNAAVFQAASAPLSASDSPRPIISIPPRDSRVVASRSSTSKKYHYSWCASGKKIKPENQIWFENEKAAIAAGYTLAGNCQ